MDLIAVDMRVAFHDKRGIPRYVRNFVRVLSEIGLKDLEVFLIIPSHHQKETWVLPLVPENFRCIFLEEKSIWHWEQFLLPGWCRRNKVGLLHMFTNRGPVFPKGVKDVHVVHDTIAIHEANWEKGVFQGTLGFFYNFISIKTSAKTASHLITVSHFSKEMILKELRVPPSKLTVIYNGIEEVFFNPPELRREKLNLPEKPFFFHLGSFDPRKNTRRVIQAFSGLSKEIRKEFPLVIAGLSFKAKERFLPLIEELGLEKEVYVLPFVSDEDLAGLYHKCFAFIWPSLWEGFGLPVLEAMAAGAPVLTSNSTSLPEISGGCALLVDPTSSEEITKGIMRLIEDRSLRKELREKGKTWAKNFTWENTVRETIDIWKKVLES